MHRALEILEIIEMICAQVHSSLMPKADRNLASLARVCRILSGPALDRLWEHQSSLMNILSCMPDDLWENNNFGEKSFVRARRQIKPSDWDRVHPYARRVKTFLFYDYDNERDTDHWSPVFEILASSLPGEHFFPNLHTIFWDVMEMPWFPFVRLFLCPGIKSATMGMFAASTHLALISTLSAQCPLLTHVTLFIDPVLHEYCSAPFSTLIHGVPRLEDLDLGTLDQAAFEHLAHMSSLQALSITMPTFIPFRGDEDPPRFVKLRRVGFGCTTHQFTTAFIAMKSWSLGSFRSMVTSVPTAAETATMYTLLTSHCAHAALRNLELGDARLNIESFPLVPACIVTSDALRILFCFHNLRHVNLAPPAGFDLDDAVLAELARAWPRLSSLTLAGSGYRAPPSRVTLGALRALAAHCRSLMFLTLAFDASVVPDAPPERGTLLRLDVADSIVVTPAPVAEYLFALFPRLLDIATGRERLDNEDAGQDRAVGLHKLWKEVLALRPKRKKEL
ncbi:hypothetical protein FB451DRAFT_1077064 [Mycena latifolia]|nr:hypothetical protein FB451DRAFT_1077064 [Mycena latifolia]